MQIAFGGNLVTLWLKVVRFIKIKSIFKYRSTLIENNCESKSNLPIDIHWFDNFKHNVNYKC